MQKQKQGKLRSRGSFSRKPKVLIIDRSSPDGRVLEELLRPMAEVSAKCNVWTAVKSIDSEWNRLAAIFVEAGLLLTSSISDHWMKLLPHKLCPRIFVISDEFLNLSQEMLSRFGVAASVRKPYVGRDVTRLIRSLADSQDQS